MILGGVRCDLCALCPAAEVKSESDGSPDKSHGLGPDTAGDEGASSIASSQQDGQYQLLLPFYSMADH